MLEESKEPWTQRSGSMLANLEHHKAWKTAGYFLATAVSAFTTPPHLLQNIWPGRAIHTWLLLDILQIFFLAKLGDIYNQVLPLYHHVIPPCNTMWPPALAGPSNAKHPMIVQGIPPKISLHNHHAEGWDSQEPQHGPQLIHNRPTKKNWEPGNGCIIVDTQLKNGHQILSNDIKCIKYIKDTRFLNPQ